MALNTRRMSGMAGGYPGGGQSNAMLEAMESFRRKHASQNKEIIHRNSELMRANTELSNKVRESQNELVALRADYAQLLTSHINIEAKNANLREQLHAAHDEIKRRDGPGGMGSEANIRMEDERFQALRITLDKVVAQLQGAQAICLLTSSDNEKTTKFYSPASPPESPPFASIPSAAFALGRQISSGSGTSASSSSSHRLERRASTQALVSTQPDLSYISEGSQEPSLSLSQQEYRPYSSSDDEAEAEEARHQGTIYTHHPHDGQFAFQHDYTGAQDQYASYETQQRQVPFLHDLQQDILASSYASSVEPDQVGQEIEQSLLSASPKRPLLHQPFALSADSPPREAGLGRSSSLSPSPTPTMPSFPTMSGPFEQTTSNATSSEQSQDSKTSSKSGRTKTSRPSLLDQLGISPSHLDVSLSQREPTSALTASSGNASSGGSTRRRSARSRDVSPCLEIESTDEDDETDGPYVVSSNNRNNNVNNATSSSSSSSKNSTIQQQRKIASASDPDGLYLSKTVRHSTSATTLREKAKAAAAAAAATAAIEGASGSSNSNTPANRVITRRRSNPTLSSSADMTSSSSTASKTPGLATVISSAGTSNSSTTGGRTERKRLSASNVEPRAGAGGKTAGVSKLVQSMQPRPSSVPLTSLDGRASLSGSSSSISTSGNARPSSVTIGRPRSGSAVHRKLPSTSPNNTKSTIINMTSPPESAETASSPVTVTITKYDDSPAPASHVTGRAPARSSKASSRARSATPEMEAEDDTVTSVNTSVLADMTAQTLPQIGTSKSSQGSTSKDKGKAKEKERTPSLSAKSSSRVDRMDRENSPLDSLDVASQESNSSSSHSQNDVSVDAGGREGRRARARVSYQEPSLNKKMRQPAGYVASIKTVASTKNSGHNLGVRRKSSLSLGGQHDYCRSSISPGPESEGESCGETSD